MDGLKQLIVNSKLNSFEMLRKSQLSSRADCFIVKNGVLGTAIKEQKYFNKSIMICISKTIKRKCYHLLSNRLSTVKVHVMRGHVAQNGGS